MPTEAFSYPFTVYIWRKVALETFLSYIFRATFLRYRKKKQQTKIQRISSLSLCFECKIEWKQEKATTYMPLRRDFALLLILGLRNVLFCVICSVELLRPEV